MCAAALAACSSDKSNGGSNSNLENDAGGSGDKSGSGGSAGSSDAGGASDCKHVDYSSYGKGATVSFKDDVLPILGFSCTASGCHRPDQKESGFNAGYRCDYTATAKWKCVFPSAPDPNPPTDYSKSHPLDDQIIGDVYDSLMAPAQTVTDGSVKRVMPGDPANSFLTLKLADQENSKGYTCTNQDSSHEQNPQPCGASMPQGTDALCDDASSRPKFDAIAEWIAQGAMNN